MKKILAAVFLPLAFFLPPVMASEDILVIEDELADLNQQLAEQLKISGYVDVEYIDAEGAKPGFRMHHLSLFFKQDLTENWRFFSEIEFEDAPKFESDGSTVDVITDVGPDGIAHTADDTLKSVSVFKDANGKLFVEAVNIDYTWRSDLNFRMGRFFTPAGIWSIDHYPPFVPTQERPKHIRNIFPQLVDGAMAYGTVPIASSFLNYNLYIGNGEGNTAKKDANSTMAVGLKASLAMPYNGRPELGATYYQDTLNNGEEKKALGVDFKMRLDAFNLQAEYADATMTPTSGSDYHIEGYYAQLLYNVDHWTYGYRYDFFDKDDRVNNNDDITVNSLFVNYHVTSNIVLKLEHHLNEYEGSKDDGTKSIVSIAVNLGS